MKYLKIFSVAILATLAVSCVKEAQDDSTLSNGGITQITAELADGQTKTVLGDDGVSVLWSPKDEINVFFDGDGVKFTSINSTPKGKTLFACKEALLYNLTESELGSLESLPWLWGVYPYNKQNTSDGESVSL